MVCLLDVAANTGVQLGVFDYKDLFDSGKHTYSKVSYRKLYFKRDKTKMEKLDQFIQDALEQKYSFSLSQHVFKKCKSKQRDGFFCSELVATAL